MFKDYEAVNKDHILDTESPMNYFKMFFDNDMINHIAVHTNLYSAHQCSTNNVTPSIVTTFNEIERFLGVLLKMCVIQAPYYRFYWESATCYEPISNVFSRNRFENIKRFVHINDTNKNRGRLYKIRPIFEKLRQNCVSMIPEEYISIDEQIIPFKGRSFLRRYMPKKPHKWGFKIFSRNGVSGMLYDYEMEGAPDPTSTVIYDKLGYCGADVVMRLNDQIPKQMGYKDIFDNYFTFIELFVKLKEQGFWDLGTLRKDRMRTCRLKSEKDLKKKGRGSYDGAVDYNTGVNIVRWFVKKEVQLASKFSYIEPVDKVTRWC